ncbi:MAG: hypothetical protein KAV87_28720 [Desulfobacteraceae bacterium]|nr:hypothetical protein [Desulfobacteraceae bacterium]
MKTLWQKLRHNQSLVISGMLAVGVAVWLYGCEPTVRSIQHPGQRLDRQTFQSEVDSYVALAASRFENLAKQEKFRQTLFNLAIEYAKGGSINPAAVAITLGNIVGLGAIIDNRRKDVVIKTLKNNAVKPSA